MKYTESACPVFKYLDINKCCGCEVCTNVCPVNALSMKTDTDGFLYPVLDTGKCVSCQSCVKSCTILNTKPEENPIEEYYAFSHKNKTILLSSASGGVFTFLRNEFIKKYKSGYTAGAIYTSDYRNIIHIISNNENEFLKMRGSKYFQSIKQDIYKKTKELLDKGNAVFFTGTPCEVSGLYKYLNKDYANLLTADFICKGTSSPKVLADYIDYQSSKKNAAVTNINMRYKWDKLDNWIPQFLYISFSNGKTLFKEFYNTELGICFKILQRKGCDSCPYREQRHYADFTLGDLHGADKNDPIFNSLGTSVVILNTKKAKEWWNISDKTDILFHAIKKDDIYEYNRNLKDPRSDKLRNNLSQMDAIKAVRRIVNPKEIIKMMFPVMLLRKITTWKRNNIK